MLMNKKGDRFYTREQPRVLGDLGFQIKQIDDSSLTSTTRKTHYIKELVPLVRDGTRIVWDAPQSKFALEATISLNQMGNADWEETMLELIGELVDDQLMDPIMRFKLIENILTVALEGSLLLKNALKTVDEEFASVSLGANLNLFDPSDVDAIMARRIAERHLKNLPNMSDVLRDVAKTKATVLSTDIGNPWQWVAWLCKDSETQEWTCEAKKTPPAGEQGDLFVADNVGGTPSFIKIGIIEKGKYHVTATGSTASLVEGRPVFSHLSDAK
jgi:hypothetical protein